MIFGYLRTLVPVTLQVDGATYTFRTHQTTVESVLREANLTTSAEDRVVPPLATPIEAGDIIQVQYARPVQVSVDGATITGRSLKHSVLDILADLGVEVSPYDKVIVLDEEAAESRASFAALRPSTWVWALPANGRIQPPLKPPLGIVVQRAVPVTLDVNGQTFPIHTAALSVGEALYEAGIVLHEADIVKPELTDRLDANMVIAVKNAIPVTILADGRRLRTRTHRTNVADVLADANITLIGLDYTRPSLDSPLTPGTDIQLVRVQETFAIEQEPVPFEVVWMPDSEMEIDTQALRQGGENGVLQKRIRVRYEDGQEVSRKLEDQGIVRPPKNKVITYGTGIVVRTLDTPNGPVEYWRRVRMLATSYSASTAGTPKTASYYGRTALGWTMRHGIVAVDPRVVHLGSNVYVPGYGPGVAGDTGGAIKYRRIDLGYDDDNLVLWYRWVDVYLLTPVPPGDSINYIIPGWPPEP